MKPVQTQMLESLGGGVRPVDLGEVTDPRAGDFDHMLDGVLHGRVRADLGVRFAPSVSGVFDPEQQREISHAVDLAMTAGSQHALILHQRRTLRIDVRNRMVEDAHELKPGVVISGIDSFMTSQKAAGEEDSDRTERERQPLLTPARVVRNASLVHTLADTPDAHIQSNNAAD